METFGIRTRLGVDHSARISMRESLSTQRCLALLLLTSLSLAGGCKQPIKTEPVKDKNISSGNDQKGYLHSDGDSVMFLQWTEIKSKLNGQMTVFYAKGSRGKSTETSSHSFEGVSDGQHISINFTGSQWTDALGGRTWAGTIAGNELTLVIPVRSGTLEPVKFRAGTVEEYNQAVFGIKQGVQAGNATTQRQNAEAARVEAEKNSVVEGNNSVGSSINRLSGSINGLEDSLRFDDVFINYSRTWEKMKADYNDLREKAAEKPLTSYRLGTVQYVLGTLQYDIGTFEHHSGTLDYKIARINEAINSVKEEGNRLRNSWGLLQRAVSANSSGTPNAQFSESDISQPLRLAGDKIQKASDEIQQASKQRASYESQAKDLNRKAESFVKSLKAVE